LARVTRGIRYVRRGANRFEDFRCRTLCVFYQGCGFVQQDIGGAALRRYKTADAKTDALSKVPRVTLVFWIVKILATTLGETGGDALSMTLKLGYAISSLIFLGSFVITRAPQVASKRYHPFLY